MAPVFLAPTSALSDREHIRLALLIGTYTAVLLSVLLLATLEDPALADLLEAFATQLR